MNRIKAIILFLGILVEIFLVLGILFAHKLAIEGILEVWAVWVAIVVFFILIHPTEDKTHDIS